MNALYKKIIPVGVILLLSVLACQVNAGGPQPPAPINPVPPVIPDPEQSVTLDPQSGQITVTFTQEQLTAYVAAEIANQPDIPLENPQVVLQNDQIEIYGHYNQSLLSADLRLVVQPKADENGNIKFKVVSADMGSIPAPANLLEQFSTQINQAIENVVDPSSTGVHIDSVTISNGRMDVTGSRQ